MRGWVDGPRYAGAGKIVLAMDQLNAHGPASFYEAFDADEARRLTRKVEIHHTPKHGSWLNVAEIELSVLGKRLKERVGNVGELAAACGAHERDRNATASGATWRFTAADARIKLKRLYPTNNVS